MHPPLSLEQELENAFNLVNIHHPLLKTLRPNSPNPYPSQKSIDLNLPRKNSSLIHDDADDETLSINRNARNIDKYIKSNHAIISPLFISFPPQERRDRKEP